MTFQQICNAFRRENQSAYTEAAELLIHDYADDLTVEAIAELAQALAHSGEILELPDEIRPFADVPSTGGPASLTTLAPPYFLAASGIRVPKISAAGSIAGAIDTLGAISGFQTALSKHEFVSVLRKAGIAHCAQSSSMCPADYSLIEVRRRHNAMRHPALATASLLAKKLMVPGTHAVFDFRLGAAGNIADTEARSREIAELFIDVAFLLSVPTSIVVTDCSGFQSSALGRLESLALLCDILQGKPLLNELDAQHLQTCITISHYARALANQSSFDSASADIKALLQDGSVWRKFLGHLQAQGSDEVELRSALAKRQASSVHTIHASDHGFWEPPDINRVKTWLKQQQTSLDYNLPAKNHSSSAPQIGLRLLANPGAAVQKDEPVIEIRMPPQARFDSSPSFLNGAIRNEPLQPRPQILAVITGDKSW